MDTEIIITRQEMLDSRPQIKDLTEMRFGKLIARTAFRGRRGCIWWNCDCDCGNTRKSSGTMLREDRCTHCGCEKSKNISKINRTHGLSKFPEFHSWWQMINRCENKNNLHYNRYGGRGIKVCDRWKGVNGLANFIIDMGARPPGHTIERIDNNGDYEPGNCRWATMREQSRNRSSNHIITIGTESKPVVDWCAQYTIAVGTFNARVKNGMDPLQALTKPIRKYRRYYAAS
jgi:hypothetical protein